MLERLEGRLLKTFVAVLEENSFSRAAEKLGYVQSTVTTHIRLLEEACRQKLFHRLSRGVKPTEAGLRLAPYAYRLLQLGSSLEEALADSGEPRGTIRIRVQESFYVSRLAEPILQFSGNYPGVRIVPETGYQEDIVAKVLDHAVDFGFVPLDPERQELLFEPLAEERLVFVASAALAERAASEGAGTLSEETVISFGAACLYNTRAAKALAENGVRPARAVELPSIGMIKNSLRCGHGYALMPSSFVRDELADGSFRVLPLGEPIPMTHGLIRRRDRELNRACSLFWPYMTDWFRHGLQPGS